jgi:hypothetical protein
MNELFKNINNHVLQFSRHFKFILAIRDTTEKMIDEIYLQEDGKPLVQLNVSTWFTLKDIAKRKIAYFKEKGIYPSSPVSLEIVETILGDTTSNESGLGDFLSKMYNYNKRRKVNYLLSALSRHPDCCKDYMNLWNIALQYERNNWELASVYKNAARQLVLRILLGLIEECKFFEAILAMSGVWYARKIITYLYRRTPINDMENEMDNLGYIGFKSLLTHLLNNPSKNSNISSTELNEKIDFIAQILQKMSSSSEKDTNWCPLVDVKFNQHNFKVDDLSKKLRECYTNKNDNESAYGVKITDAGRFFLESLLPTFEYFACRYETSSAPLFSSLNLILTNDDPKYTNNMGTEHIRKMQKIVFKRIKDITDDDTKFFIADDNVNFDAMYSYGDICRRYCYAPYTGITTDFAHGEQCHPLRILHSHIGYFDNYRIFILTITKDCGNPLYSSEIKKGLSLTILSILEKYVKKIKKLIDNAIGEDEKIIKGSPYVGSANVDHEKKKYEAYIKNIEAAKKAPENLSIRIIAQ